jgi:cytochrome d ubiquinol oxidase subunit II
MTDWAAGPLFGLPLQELWYVVLFLLLAAFLVLDGFDFGVGALFATRDDPEEREQLLASIGPFWDGNEVWLVLFGGAMFAAFPRVYANLFSRHYLLMFAILGALIIRGVSPEMYEQRHDDRWQRAWGRAFVVGSVASPLFLGMFTANWLLGSATTLTLPGVVVGVALVALTVVDGAAFLGIKTRGEIRDEWAHYGTRALVAYLVLFVLAVVYLYLTRPDLRGGLTSAPILGLVVLSLAFAGVYAASVRRHRFYVAFAAAAGLIVGLVAVVATLMFPLIDPAAGLTYTEAIVPSLPLNIMSVVVAIFLPLVIGYFIVLYNAFGGPVEAGETY